MKKAPAVEEQTSAGLGSGVEARFDAGDDDTRVEAVRPPALTKRAVSTLPPILTTATEDNAGVTAPDYLVAETPDARPVMSPGLARALVHLVQNAASDVKPHGDACQIDRKGT